MNPSLVADAGGPLVLVYVVAPIAAGVLGFIALVLGGLWWLRRRRRLRERNPE